MRVLVVQPSLHPPGGGNGVAVWMLEALRGRHDVTVLTWGPVDVGLINGYYGTSLTRADFRVLRMPWLTRALFALVPSRLDHMRRCLMLRECKRLGAGYDVVFTANNEADFGRRGIQYIHFPWGYWPRPSDDLRWYHPRFLLAAYYGVCKWLGRFDEERVRQNLTLTNSAWTAGKVRELLGVTCRVLHPPVTGDFRGLPWEEREEAFISIGRLAPEKEVEKIVEIVRRVRERRPGVRLRIVGSADDRGYTALLQGIARESGGWVSVHEDLTRRELEGLLVRHRYGIHGMREEHFGMAIAEMVRAGCVAFAPAAGGQVEILDDERLLYDGVEDAAAKILRVLEDRDLEDELRRHLAARRDVTSAEAFMEAFRAIVDEFVRAP